MNRRDFTKGLAAAGLAPALPLPSLAKAAPAAMAAKDPMYFWANFLTRVHNNCSPDMFTRHLKLDPAKSAELYSQLISDGSITTPDAFGLSRSTNPLYPEFSKVTGHGVKVAENLERPKSRNVIEEKLAPQDETELMDDDSDDNSKDDSTDKLTSDVSTNLDLDRVTEDELTVSETDFTSS